LQGFLGENIVVLLENQTFNFSALLGGEEGVVGGSAPHKPLFFMHLYAEKTRF
jgi:hypothetical protein